jgi:hypothetical protein
MTNPFTGKISTAIKTLFKNGVTEIIRGCSVPCQLRYYITKYDTDTAVEFNPVGKKQPNRPLAGGQVPFSHSQPSPMSDAEKKKATVQTVSIDMCVYWDIKKFYPMSVQVNVRDGYIQTMCSIDHLEDIKKASEIIIDTSLTQRVKLIFERASEPEPAGLGENSFLLTLWKRV